jgi:hypothetical protein
MTFVSQSAQMTHIIESFNIHQEVNMNSKHRALVLGCIALLVAVVTGSAVFAQSEEPGAVLSPASSIPVIEVKLPERATEAVPSGWNVWTAQSTFTGDRNICLYSSSFKPNSVVLVEASEGYYNNRHMGAAKVTVNNVVPSNGQVCAWITVNWHHNLPIAIDFVWFHR